MNSQQVSDFYYTALNAHNADFWSSADSADAHRNIAHVLRQHPGAMIGQDRLNLAAGASAGELADYLERRATRLEAYGE
jgi:hypothetical protein